MKTFLRHGLLTVLGTAILSAAVFGIFGWTQADREIHAICGFLDASSTASLQSTLDTLEWSEAMRTEESVSIDSRWNLRSSSCKLTLHNGKVSAQLN